jgi:hypothetical protein
MFRNRLGYECGDRGAKNAREKLHRDNGGGMRGAVNHGNKSGGQHG